VYGWEADLLTVTKAGQVHEYEIKVSRSDWLSEYRSIASAFTDVQPDSSVKKFRAQCLSGRHENKPTIKPSGRQHDCPNRFWMVVGPGVLWEQEVPEYAGLIEVQPFRDSLIPQVLRKAPKLHGEPLSDKHWRMVARGICLRYWQRKEGAA